METEIEKIRFHLSNRYCVRTYQENVIRKWNAIAIDSPVQARIDAYLRNPWVYWNHHIALECISRLYPITSYLEIGSRIGASAVIVLGNRTCSSLTAIDMFMPYAKDTVEESEENFIRQIEPFYKTSQTDVQVMKENSHTALKKLIELGFTYQLILVDGDHSKEGAMEDLEDSIQLLDKNSPSFIVFDDINNTGCPWLRNVALQFEKKYKLNSIWNDEHDNGTVIFSRH